MHQQLPIVLAQIKTGNNSENLSNDVRQIIYSCINENKSPKKYTIT